MSDYTDAVLEGLVCEHCGVFIDPKGIDGFPQLCKACAKEICKQGGMVRKVGNGNWQDITPVGKSVKAHVKEQAIKCEMCNRSKP